MDQQPAPTFNHPRRSWARARRGLAALLWACCCATGRPAFAQESAETLAARALFDEARRLMSAGQYGTACLKLEESQRLHAGIGTQFNLAECYEKQGRYASAWSAYLHVAADTKALGQPERERVARERAHALEKRVAYLLLQVPTPVAGLEITLDGSVMGAALWGVRTPVDPGEHAVGARAPGHRPWQAVARIPERSATLELQVPKLAPLASTPAAAPTASSTAAPPAAAAVPAARAMPPATEAAEPVTAPDHTVPYVIGGVGAGLVVLSGLFGLRFLHDNAQAKDICSSDPNACPHADMQKHASLLSSARGARTAGFVTLGLGLAGMGTAAVWLLQSTPAEVGGTQRVVWSAELGPAGAGLECSVRF